MSHSVEVTVVVPVLNEEVMLPRLIASLEAQTLAPVEVLVVDGGSKDQTCALVRQYASQTERPFPIRLIEVPGARPGGGRNAGARAARTELIACSDCGVDLDPRWLESLTAPLAATPNAELVVGAIEGRGRSPFERFVADLIIRRPNRVQLLYSGGASVAFTKTAWERLGGYPEDVYPCEDAMFLRAAHEAGVSIARANDSITYWRPRGSLAALWRQYRSYAWGDAMIHFGRRRHLLRYGFYAVCLAALLCFPFPWLQLAGALALGAYLIPPTFKVWRQRREPAIWLWGPCILLTKDLAQMSGYLAGQWNRLRGGTRDYGRPGRRAQRVNPQPVG